MSERVLIRNAALSLVTNEDGTQRTEGARHDLLIADGVIERLASGGSLAGQLGDAADIGDIALIEADGLVALPGFTDVYARLREPGPGGRGDLASETKAALGAGFTSVLCSPDTTPVIDNTATLELVLRRAAVAGGARVLPMAALTQGLDGQQLGELATLKAGGCVAASQADTVLEDTGVLYSAMQYARTFDLPLIMTARDAHLGAGGCVNQGAIATRLGLPGIPVAAETVALGRLLELARETGCRLHVSRLSSARAVALIAEARQDGLAVTADVGIHHLFFTEQDLAGYDARYLSAVPFRSVEDRAALRTGIADGTIDAICSDHAPHDSDARLAPFAACAPGLSAYDHFLHLLLALPAVLGVPFTTVLRRVTEGPSRIIGSEPSDARAGLAEGTIADVVLVDPQADCVNTKWLSAGRNSPLDGVDRVVGDADAEHSLLGAVRVAVVAGEVSIR